MKPTVVVVVVVEVVVGIGVVQYGINSEQYGKFFLNFSLFSQCTNVSVTGFLFSEDYFFNIRLHKFTKKSMFFFLILLYENSPLLSVRLSLHIL